MKRSMTSLLVFALLAPVIQAQENDRTHTRPPLQVLGDACGGAWKDVEAAVDSLRRLDAKGSTDASRQKTTCLLSAIGETRFKKGDDAYDELLTAQAVKILVSAYGPANYDFFASQIAVQPQPVRGALLSALMERGHPEAFASYFAARRMALAAGQTLPESPGAPAVFRPLIERGACAAALCSSRVGETLRVISSNLDILTMELESATRVHALTTSDEELHRVERIRSDARDVLAAVGRVRRGEATIGNVR